MFLLVLRNSNIDKKQSLQNGCATFVHIKGCDVYFKACDAIHKNCVHNLQEHQGDSVSVTLAKL